MFELVGYGPSINIIDDGSKLLDGMIDVEFTYFLVCVCVCVFFY